MTVEKDCSPSPYAVKVAYLDDNDYEIYNESCTYRKSRRRDPRSTGLEIFQHGYCLRHCGKILWVLISAPIKERKHQTRKGVGRPR